MVKVLDFTKPHLLRDEGEYAAAIAEIERLLDKDPPPISEEYERLEFLSVLVQAYEEAHFPMPERPAPQEVVDFMLVQKSINILSETGLLILVGIYSPHQRGKW